MRDTRDATLSPAGYSSRVSCVVDLAGDVDFAAYQHPPALLDVIALLGGTDEEVPERYCDASPLSWIDGETVPFLVVHGDQDDVVPLAQSERLVAALRNAGGEAEYVQIANAGHGGLTWSRVGPAVLSFPGRHLRGA